MRSLTVISHTEHYRSSSGTIVGLASTVMEINQLLEIFDRIEHVAMLHGGEPSANTMAYASENIKFIPLPALGGTSLTSKLNIVRNAPKVLNIIKHSVNRTDYFQFRAPTGIGVFVIPYLMFRSKLKGWFKYAGNWKQKNAPWSYQLQRWLLLQQDRKVTINGVWEHQPKNCLSFENPCITKTELLDGENSKNRKQFVHGQLELCFVGRLEKEKGFDLFLKALKQLEQNQQKKILKVHVVGLGAKHDAYISASKSIPLTFLFHGLLDRSNVRKIYRACHGIVLPSVSEGFPKVIAEAMVFGCVPIVSDVSALGSYIKNTENGFIMESVSLSALLKNLNDFLNLTKKQHLMIMKNQFINYNSFTYAYYNSRLQKEIL